MTKGSKNHKKSKKRCLSRNMGQELLDERQQCSKKSRKPLLLDCGVICAELSPRNAACDIVFFGFTYYNSQRVKVTPIYAL